MKADMMNKKELVGFLSKKLGVTKKEAEARIDSFVALVPEVLKAGGAKVVGLGNIYVEDVEAKERRNPATGETFMAEPTKKVKVEVSKTLKDVVKSF